MKHLRILLSLILVLLLCGCGAQTQTSYTVTTDSYTLTIDPETSTITNGQDVYTYTFQSGGHSTRFDITYPNGATYYWTKTEYGGHGGWSEDYDDSRYIPGDKLIAALGAQTPRSSGGGNFLLGLLILGFGIWYTFSPYSAWYLAHGWLYADAEPSDAALGMYRVGGVFSMIVGVIAMLTGL